MPTAAFVAGPEALFRAQPGPLLKNRVFRLEPLFFPSSSLGGPWEAPGRPLGGPWEALGGCPGHPGTGCPGAPPRGTGSRGVPGPSWDKCPGAPPGHPQDSCPGGPRTPRDAPRTLSRGPPGTPKFEILGAWSVLFFCVFAGVLYGFPKPTQQPKTACWPRTRVFWVFSALVAAPRLYDSIAMLRRISKMRFRISCPRLPSCHFAPHGNF